MRPATSRLAWILRSFVLAAGVSILSAAPCSAGTMMWSEVGDAGDLPGTAQVTTGMGVLDTITGTIDNSAFEDIDMFRIRITDPDGFSATLFATGSPGFGLLDTYLFLFDSTGFGVVADNDASFLPFPPDPLSQIPTGSLSGLAVGDYYLAVSTALPFAGDIPLDGSGVPIFDPADLAADDEFFSPPDPPTTIDPDPAAGPIMSWQFDMDDLDQGGYEIQLTGAAFAQSAVIPEPLSLVIWAPGLFALLPLRRSRRNGGRRAC